MKQLNLEGLFRFPQVHREGSGAEKREILSKSPA